MARYTGMTDIRRLAGITHTSVFGLDEMSTEPKLRAAERMADAKKRGIKSPDRADSLALTFAYPVEKKDDWVVPTGQHHAWAALDEVTGY